jgi:hypothetical protein
MWRSIAITLILIFMSTISSALARSPKADFSGFATLTGSYSDDNDIGFRSNYINDSHTGFTLNRDSILGIQANISLNDDLDAVLQYVWQDRRIREWDNYLELAFLRYRPLRNWAIRVGRMNTDLYLISEYPYVGYAYLWVRPPHEFYSFSASVGHFDGADIEYSDNFYDGFLQLKLAAGQTSTKLRFGTEPFTINFSNILTLSAAYQIGDFTVRASHSLSDVKSYEATELEQLQQGLAMIPTELWPQAKYYADGIAAQPHEISYSAFGLAYDHDNWLLQTEVGRSQSSWLTAPSNYSAYVSLGYRQDDITYYSSLALVKNRRSLDFLAPQLSEALPAEIRVPIQQIAAGTLATLQRNTSEQQSLSIGAKWHYSEKLVFKAQADHFNIDPYGGGLWDVEAPLDIESAHQINVFSVSASLVF